MDHGSQPERPTKRCTASNPLPQDYHPQWSDRSSPALGPGSRLLPSPGLALAPVSPPAYSLQPSITLPLPSISTCSNTPLPTPSFRLLDTPNGNTERTKDHLRGNNHQRAAPVKPAPIDSGRRQSQKGNSYVPPSPLDVSYGNGKPRQVVQRDSKPRAVPPLLFPFSRPFPGDRGEKRKRDLSDQPPPDVKPLLPNSAYRGQRPRDSEVLAVTVPLSPSNIKEHKDKKQWPHYDVPVSKLPPRIKYSRSNNQTAVNDRFVSSLASSISSGPGEKTTSDRDYLPTPSFSPSSNEHEETGQNSPDDLPESFSTPLSSISKEQLERYQRKYEYPIAPQPATSNAVHVGTHDLVLPPRAFLKPLRPKSAGPSYPVSIAGPSASHKDSDTQHQDDSQASQKRLSSPFFDCLGMFGDKAFYQTYKPLVNNSIKDDADKLNGYVKIRWHDLATFCEITRSSNPPEDRGQKLQYTGIPRKPNRRTCWIPLQQHLELFITNLPPPPVPPEFGHAGRRGTTIDRTFWSFYVHNWCSGRSVLDRTNLWLIDFAAMEGCDGVSAAINCLAGSYIYDYDPDNKSVQRRVNALFQVAETRLSELLNSPQVPATGEAEELVTITVLLSMQDIVIWERRAKKPRFPRWLQGFLYAEQALRITDNGVRFWSPRHVQMTSLRMSLSTIVGRAIILSQPMLPLPILSFHYEHESERFGWLLEGTEEEIYEIHGACGFSRKLLHIFSQVTICATRLSTSRNSLAIMTMTLLSLLRCLNGMRQWSRQTASFEDAKVLPPIIDVICNRLKQDPDFVVKSHQLMTDVTAEAWRFTCLIYLQCRGLRLPRNHPDVAANVSNLATCISVMPAYGNQFTAQAPLFPVFLLGVMAIAPEHRMQSVRWFEEVIVTPVRSSVLPLYASLQRIWLWIDEKVPLRSQRRRQPVSLFDRDPWFESLTDTIFELEDEVICTT